MVSCNSDGLRYAFILERGSIGRLPTHIDYPYLENDKLFVRVVYDDGPGPRSITRKPCQPTATHVDSVDDKTLIRQGVVAFLKVLDDIESSGRCRPETRCSRSAGRYCNK